MKVNNKGFTVVEMGLSFCLIFTICILLFQIIFTVKDIYVKSEIETQLLTRQGILLNLLYKDCEKNEFVSLQQSSTTYAVLKFNNNQQKEFEIVNSSSTNKYIKYDNYIWVLPKNTNISNISSGVKKILGANYYFIKVSITNNLTGDKDYGIKFMCTIS